MKRLFLLIVLFVTTLAASSQSEVQSSAIQTLEHTPGAPNTATLAKYFDVPVTMSNGVPNIQIPLYTIKSGNLTLPISLSYHAGGIRVNDPASWVGLGWTLNCGGMMTKKVNGLDDYHATTQQPSQNSSGLAQHTYMDPIYALNQESGFASITAVIDSSYAGYNPQAIMHLLGRVVLNQYDGESDQYYYSTPEGSGMIYYDQVRQKYQTDHINGWIADGGSNGWNLKTNKGIYYGFGAQERTLCGFYTSGNVNDTYASAWYLTDMIDKINNRSIGISYETSSYHWVANGSSEWKDYNLYGGGAIYFGGSNEPRQRWGTDVTISQIYFNEGRVQFIKDANTRLDFDGPKALKEIRIYDNNNQLKKKFIFNYFYFSSRLFLESVKEFDAHDTLASNPPYRFIYDTSITMTGRFSYAQDIYGYYNGKTSNTTLIPTDPETLSLGLPAFANRSIDTSYTKACMLKNIAYPTGGTLSVEFENNLEGTNILAGGMRVKLITNYDSLTGNRVVTEYRYKRTDGHGSGNLLQKPVFNYHYGYMSGNTGFGIVRVSGEPIHSLFSNQGTNVFYDQVEQIHVSTADTIKTRHYYYNYDEIGNDLPYHTFMAGVPYDKYPNWENFRGIEYRTETFKFENGQYQLLKVDSLIYTSLNQFKEYVWNVQCAWSYFGMLIVWVGNDPYTQTNMNSFPSINAYKLFHENLINKELFSKTYAGANVLEQAAFKEYDKSTGSLKKVVTVSSNGDTLKTYYTYVSDFAWTNSTHSVNLEINDLIDQNRTGLPVEVISTRQPVGSSTEIVLGASLYFYEAGKVKKIYQIKTATPYSTMTKAHANNSGFFYDSNYQLESEVEVFDANDNPVQVTQKSKTQSLIWDKEEVIGAVVNAKSNEIAASSFETSAKGNWIFSGTPTTDLTAPTGNKVYNLDSSNVSKSGLTSGKTYVVTYWSKNGGKSVNNTSGIGGPAINGWTYYEHQITNPSSNTITVSGSGVIDELRVYPKGALMTTYTYLPLVGTSSQNDANNRITYYSYDGYGRLSLVRDQNRNILKKICYNYKGETEECSHSIVYRNVVKSGNFARNNCGSGYTGSFVTYTVPASTYTSSISQAAADQLAQNDVNANGQAYANTNGSCSSNTIYAKLTYENVTYTWSGSYGDVVVSFYEDESCTQPLGASLNLAIQQEMYNCLFSSSTYSTSNYSVSGATSFIVLSGVTFEYSDSFMCYSYIYTLLDRTGYIVVL